MYYQQSLMKLVFFLFKRNSLFFAVIKQNVPPFWTLAEANSFRKHVGLTVILLSYNCRLSFLWKPSLSKTVNSQCSTAAAAPGSPAAVMMPWPDSEPPTSNTPKVVHWSNHRQLLPRTPFNNKLPSLTFSCFLSHFPISCIASGEDGFCQTLYANQPVDLQENEGCE